MKTLRIPTSMFLLVALSGCATIGPYRGPIPAPGAVTVFEKYLPDRATSTGASAYGPPAWLVPGTSDSALRRIGTIAIPPRESLVVLVYGDNRPGLNVMTASYGVPIIVSALTSREPLYLLWGLVNVPIALLQLVLPTLDGIRDLISFYGTHRYTGGNEKGVLKALERSPNVDLIVNTGDVVEDGRRGKQWEDYVRRHTTIRQRYPYLATVGNHERTWHEQGRANWNAVMGAPATDQKYWFAMDLPDTLARFVFMDSNVLADPKSHYPDSIERALSIEQIAWADSVLSLPARYKFIVLHHPLVTTGHYFSDWKVADSEPVEIRRRARLLELCRRRKVTAVLAGHEHLYQRVYVTDKQGKDGFWHISTGGGGSPLYHISKRDRLAAIAQTLPDSSKVAYPGVEHSVYNYCRLVIRRKPGKEEMGAGVFVYNVNKRGDAKLIDIVNLGQGLEAKEVK